MLVEKIKELETKHKKDIDELEEKNAKHLIELEKKYEERISQLERQLIPVQKQKSSEELILAEKEKSLIILHNRRIQQLNESIGKLKSSLISINKIKVNPLEFIHIPEVKQNYEKWNACYTETLNEAKENRMNMINTQNSELIVLLLKENVFLEDFFKLWIEFSGICKYILEEKK